MDLSSMMDDPPTPNQRHSNPLADNFSAIVSEDGSTDYVLDPEQSLKSPASVLRPWGQDLRSTNRPEPNRRVSNSQRLSNSQRPTERAERRTSHRRKHESSHDPRKKIGSDLIFQEESPWSKEKETILMGPYDYMDGHPGKDIRSQLIAGFNAWLRVPRESLAVITKVVGMLHTASLLVDDVEDSSLLRRGVPVAHTIFGTAQTINSANYVYFRALHELQKLQSPKAIEVYTEELVNLHRGQGMDLFWRDTLTCPTEEEYLEMVGNKTGGLFRLAVKLMQAESSSDRNCVPLVNTIGLLFQILDDYINLSSVTYAVNKGLAEDLTEGKFSFPIIHSIRYDPSNLVLINILKQKTHNEEVKRYAIAYMERTGSFAYTRGVLRDLTDRALALVDEMEAGEQTSTGDGVRAILEKLRVEEPGAATSATPGGAQMI